MRDEGRTVTFGEMDLAALEAAARIFVKDGAGEVVGAEIVVVVVGGVTAGGCGSAVTDAVPTSAQPPTPFTLIVYVPVARPAGTFAVICDVLVRV